LTTKGYTNIGSITVLPQNTEIAVAESDIIVINVRSTGDIS